MNSEQELLQHYCITERKLNCLCSPSGLCINPRTQSNGESLFCMASCAVNARIFVRTSPDYKTESVFPPGATTKQDL